MARQVGLRLAYRACARLLYIGQRLRRHYEGLGVSDARLVFSPYCVDTTPFETDEDARRHWRARTRAALGLAPDALVVLFAGKVSERKGVDLLPEAIRRLPDPLRRRAALVLLGDGALRPQVEAEARTTPAIPFHCTGFRNQRQLSPYYHAADVLVLPSRRAETWGLVVNEALHHGVPCVVSDRVGCAPDSRRRRDGGRLPA